MEDNVIEVSSVSKRFSVYEVRRSGSFVHKLFRKKYLRRALNNVSFSIKEGEVVALLGKNGSGKSTLIKILSGILHADSGRVKVLGLDPWKQRIRLASLLGVVLGAHGQLFWNLPPIDAFEYIRGVYGIKQSDYEHRMNHFLEMLELKNIYKRQVRTLSYGEQMKCNFMASILHSPKIVLLDEPMIGVDLPSKTELKNTILEMQEKEKTTFILTTHIVEDMMIAGRVILLNKGGVVFDDTRPKLETVFGDKRHVNLHLSNPLSINLKPYGKVIGSKGDMITLEVSKELLKTKGFLKLLNRKEVLDYSVTEPGLNFVLGKFYAGLDRANK